MINKKKSLAQAVFIALFSFGSVFLGCGDGFNILVKENYPYGDPADSAKDILSFSFLSADNTTLATDISGTVGTDTINLTVPYGADITNLIPDITISGVSVSPDDGMPADFTGPVAYTVTADDFSTKDYTVTVNMTPADAKDILSFNFLVIDNSALSANVTGIVGANTVNLTVPYGTNVTALIPDITISGLLISPKDEVSADFTLPVTYTVTAVDGTIKDYTVTVSVALNDQNDMLSFIFLDIENDDLTADYGSTPVGNNVNIVLPHGTAINNLIPDIILSPGANVIPFDGEAKDFSLGSIEYNVTAMNGSVKSYTVTVTVALNDQNDMLSFNFLDIENDDLTADYSNTPVGNIVNIVLPHGTVINNLTPDISKSEDAKVSPFDGEAKDFSLGSIEYIVTAENGATQSYTVSVTVALNDQKDITSFNFLVADPENSELSADVFGSIGANTINLIVPFGTNVTSLSPAIVLSAADASLIHVDPEDFSSSPVTYTVTAENGTAKEYYVTVSQALNTAKDIQTFDFLDSANTALSVDITGDVGANTVVLTVPYGTNVTALLPSIAITGASVNPLSGNAGNFTTPQTYTVTAADSSFKDYTVIVNFGTRLTLRPNAAGDETNIDDRDGAGSNWDAVNDVTPDGTSTRVKTSTSDWKRDLYGIPNLGSVTAVDKIRITVCLDSYLWTYTYGLGKIVLKTNGVVYESGVIDVGDDWVNYTSEWTKNPSNNSAWTWADIDNLQIGVSLLPEKEFLWWYYGVVSCTQVYVEVDYRP